MSSQQSQSLYDEWHSRLAPDQGADSPWHCLARRYID